MKVIHLKEDVRERIRYNNAAKNAISDAVAPYCRGGNPPTTRMVETYIDQNHAKIAVPSVLEAISRILGEPVESLYEELEVED